MRAAIRAVFSADVDVGDYTPPDPENDGVWVRFLIGPAGMLGEESFDVLVCTPSWLRDVVVNEGPQIGRHHLIVDTLDLRQAIEFLRAAIEQIEGPDWTALAIELGRLGRWEFEDYQFSGRPVR